MAARGWVLVHFSRGSSKEAIRRESGRLRALVKARGLGDVRLDRVVAVRRIDLKSQEAFNAFLEVSAATRPGLTTGARRLCGLIRRHFSHSEAYEIVG